MPSSAAASSSSSSSSSFNAASLSTLRARSYLVRLPLFTRAVAGVIVVVWALGVVLWSILHVFELKTWGALIPAQIGLRTLYRLTTFPFIHLNIFHAALNLLALTPLLERFESEHGTLMSVALFFGPLTTLPSLLYVFLERMILRSNTSVMGASMWVFLLLGMEAMRMYKMNPYLVIGTHNIPTWTMPLIVVLCVAALVPNTSLVGHVCGLAMGYICGLGYLKYMAPPERVLRFLEGKLNLLARLPHYVSVDQKTYGRFGVLPTTNAAGGTGVAIGLVGSGPTGQRLGSA